ncbi:MAG: aldo/keto reductase [Alphaproteobacteria bacterium]|nr:aldo/keto reductase [Alphaproteobacteria bacterium]
MKKRKLGKSGIEVSEIGLGCWQFGGDFGAIDDARALATLSAAAEAGVTFFDTADVYGAGHSETLIGQYCRDSGARPTIATKVGRSAELYPGNYAYEDVRRHLEASAKRLQTDQIDLIQLHCVPTEVLRDGAIFDVMNRLVDEGMCRHWGASLETLEEADICLGQENLTSLQIIFNVFRQDAVWKLFERASAANVGIIVRLPLASGLLTGKFAADTVFEPSDHRNYNRDGAAFSVGETFSGIELATGVELANELKRFVPDGWSLADFSLRWILDHPAVSSVIAGCSRPTQVEANARVTDLPPLSDDVHSALKAFYQQRVRSQIRCPV